MGANLNKARTIVSPPKLNSPQILRTKEVKQWVADAIELMVFSAYGREEAAKAMGKSDLSLRQWFQTKPVMQFYTQQCEVLRRGERHKNITRAVDIRDNSESDKASLEAIKVLETDFDAKNKGLANNGLSVNINIAPGYITDVSHVSDKAKAILAASKRGPAVKVIDHE